MAFCTRHGLCHDACAAGAASREEVGRSGRRQGIKGLLGKGLAAGSPGIRFQKASHNDLFEWLIPACNAVLVCLWTDCTRIRPQ